MARPKALILALLASYFTAGNVALKVRKIPPAEGGQCGKPDDTEGDDDGGETCKGKPGDHDDIFNSGLH